MDDEQQARIIAIIIILVLIKPIIQAYRKRKGIPPKKPLEPTKRTYRFHYFGRRLGIACRNLFKKHASNK